MNRNKGAERTDEKRRAVRDSGAQAEMAPRVCSLAVFPANEHATGDIHGADGTCAARTRTKSENSYVAVVLLSWGIWGI